MILFVFFVIHVLELQKQLACIAACNPSEDGLTEKVHN